MSATENVLKEIVKEHLEEMDFSRVVFNAVKELVQQRISNEVHVITKEIARKIVEQEVSQIMQNPIQFDDGYNKPPQPIEFEWFFKKELKNILSGHSYDLRRMVEKLTQSEVQKLYENHVAQIQKMFVEKVSEGLNLKDVKP